MVAPKQSPARVATVEMRMDSQQETSFRAAKERPRGFQPLAATISITITHLQMQVVYQSVNPTVPAKLCLFSAAACRESSVCGLVRAAASQSQQIAPPWLLLRMVRTMLA